jgi:hypothetical protein
MKVEAILLANAAMVDPNSLLNVEGACWRYVERDAFPTTLGGNVCGVVLIEDADFGSVHTISLEVFDDSGQVAGSAGSMIFDCREASEEMSTPRLAFAIPFVTVIREPTLLKARVTSNGGELAGPFGDRAAHEAVRWVVRPIAFIQWGVQDSSRR